MALHPDTREQLSIGKNLMIKSMREDIELLLDLLSKTSPLTDMINIIQSDGIKFQTLNFSSNGSWMPIRNVLRTIAMLTKISEVQIESISFDDMYCGCDNFKGGVKVRYVDGSIREGGYKWRWTAFNDYKRNFDKFEKIPDLVVSNLKI